ncbi:MAG: hypothetical protein QG670_2253 [Thermoproteota archaeon]|nr:hypothetical protein [Thermoproteota archaeon]
MSRIKVGIALSLKHTGSNSWKKLIESIQRCEELGYYSVGIGDHLTSGPIGSRLEAWTVLSALAAITSKIKLSPMVICNNFRPPSLLAKMAATLDVISSGRLEFAIGAGWNETEHIAYGLHYPNLQERIARLSETLDICRRMWVEEKSSYLGKYYEIHNAVCEPKPVQKPYPPIMVGGAAKSTLRTVAKNANIWNWSGSPEDYSKKLKVLKRYCSKEGRDFGEIEKSYFSNISAVYGEKELKQFLKPNYVERRLNVSLEDYIKNIKTRSLLGTPDEIMEKIKAYEMLGVTYFILHIIDWEIRDTLKTMMDEVFTKL